MAKPPSQPHDAPGATRVGPGAPLPARRRDAVTAC